MSGEACHFTLRLLKLNFLSQHTSREAVNQELSYISFRKFLQYYQESDHLAEYTIQTELSRMVFSVTYQGLTTSNKQEIEDIYYETPFEDVWRMANQSIFADILVALQKRYLRSDLSISIVSLSSSFDIQLETQRLEASSRFVVTVPTAKGMERLQLSSFAANISVDLKARGVSQRIASPELKVVFDDQIIEAADAIDSCTRDMYASAGISGNKGIPVPNLQAARSQLLSVGQKISNAGEGLLVGVVGRLGKIVGANRSDNGLQLYRREEEVPQLSPNRLEKHNSQSTSDDGAMGSMDTAPQQEVKTSDSGRNKPAPAPASTSLFGTWFKVAETFVNVGQMGVQLALAR